MDIKFTGKQIGDDPLDLSIVDVTISTRNINQLLKLRVKGQRPYLRRKLSDGTVMYLSWEDNDTHYAERGTPMEPKLTKTALEIA